MSYLVSFQLKKILGTSQGLAMSNSNMDDSRCDDSRSARGLTPSAVMKFNNFFKQNLVKLLVEESLRDQLSDEANEAPKYSVCFTDLAEFLNLKDEVMLKVA